MGTWMWKEDSLANCHSAVKRISWNRNWTWTPPPPPFPAPHPSLSPSLYQRLRGLFFFFCFFLFIWFTLLFILFFFFQMKRDRTFPFVFHFLGLCNQARIQDGLKQQKFTLTPLEADDPGVTGFASWRPGEELLPGSLLASGSCLQGLHLLGDCICTPAVSALTSTQPSSKTLLVKFMALSDSITSDMQMTPPLWQKVKN